ncbi:MAG: hypothetical protein OEV99_08465 [Nitrospira sp.]|nr:hypothetical protein [Nitrospira sp.]MDH4369868.1 hypothetical protein [Nitrospira sp.]MDH5499310.1 hypothetical protein [Nitrospira sp.]MDH5726713.1 hypothetical protein [Nitrospira sp.]
MNNSLGVCSVVAAILFGVSFAFANPSMLPNHAGYPMDKAVDPVHGQSLANDPGQRNAVGDQALHKAAVTDVDHVKQSLSINRQDERILEKPGAGMLPKVEGPVIKIEPPVKEATEVIPEPK